MPWTLPPPDFKVTSPSAPIAMDPKTTCFYNPKLQRLTTDKAFTFVDDSLALVQATTTYYDKQWQLREVKGSSPSYILPPNCAKTLKQAIMPAKDIELGDVTIKAFESPGVVHPFRWETALAAPHAQDKPEPAQEQWGRQLIDAVFDGQSSSSLFFSSALQRFPAHF